VTLNAYNGAPKNKLKYTLSAQNFTY